MVANGLGVAGKVKKGQMQCRGKQVWVTEEWLDITVWVEKQTFKVGHVDVPVPKSQATMNRWIRLRN